jgi:hypothetical protein
MMEASMKLGGEYETVEELNLAIADVIEWKEWKRLNAKNI